MGALPLEPTKLLKRGILIEECEAHNLENEGASPSHATNFACFV
jgi:hypothetical protein